MSFSGFDGQIPIRQGLDGAELFLDSIQLEKHGKWPSLTFVKKQFAFRMFLRYPMYALVNLSLIYGDGTRNFIESRRDGKTSFGGGPGPVNRPDAIERGAKVGVSRTTASRWNRALRQKGVESLKKRRATGRPSRLTKEQFLMIPDIYAQGAVMHGFPDNRWTTARLATVIEARFGVRYDHDHVGRLMQKLGLRESRVRSASPAFASAAYAAAPYPPNANRNRHDIAPVV
jgi:transposase